jgi:hypothetical protein
MCLFHNTEEAQAVLSGNEVAVTVLFSARGSYQQGGYAPWPLFECLWRTKDGEIALHHNKTNQIKCSVGQINLDTTAFSDISLWRQYRLSMMKLNSAEAEITVSVDGNQVWKNRCPITISNPANSAGDNLADSIVLRHPEGSFPHVVFGYIVIIPSMSEQSLEAIAAEAGFDPFLYPAVDESQFTFEPLPPVPSIGNSLLADALDALPAEGGIINVEPGTYAGPLSIRQKDVALIGSDPFTTIVRGYAALTNGIRRNVLVHVGSDSADSNPADSMFKAENITFWNAGSLWNASIGYDERRGAAFGMEQCTAEFKHCRFLGEQDTLYLKSGIARFDDCYIEGDIDFICGGATVLFNNCHLHILNHAEAFITAAAPVNECIPPQHPLYEELTGKVQVEGFPGLRGFIFHRCLITIDAAMKQPIYLGRGPWRNGSGLPDAIKYDVRSSVTYIDCSFGTKEEPFLLDRHNLWRPMDAPMERELYQVYGCRLNGEAL